MTTPIYTPTRSMSVRHGGGERYEIAVRHHAVAVDQPTTDGGSDSAPTPVELFVASLAGCVAFNCGRYLSRHGVSRDGLTVTARYTMASDMPTRISDIRLTVHTPDALTSYRRDALRSVAEHCTIHNTVSARRRLPSSLPNDSSRPSYCRGPVASDRHAKNRRESVRSPYHGRVPNGWPDITPTNDRCCRTGPRTQRSEPNGTYAPTSASDREPR